MRLTSRLLLTITVTLGSFLLIGLSVGRGAGNNAADEAAIRKIIAREDKEGPGIRPQVRTADAIFFSPAYKSPVIGAEKGVPAPAGHPVSDRVPNSQKTRTEPIRIVVSDSRDLAYEYSRQILEFDMKSGEHIKINNSVLRVWQKRGADWKEAAVFYQASQ
jgi:hypothetical protein